MPKLDTKALRFRIAYDTLKFATRELQQSSALMQAEKYVTQHTIKPF